MGDYPGLIRCDFAEVPVSDRVLSLTRRKIETLIASAQNRCLEPGHQEFIYAINAESSIVKGDARKYFRQNNLPLNPVGHKIRISFINPYYKHNQLEAETEIMGYEIIRDRVLTLYIKPVYFNDGSGWCEFYKISSMFNPFNSKWERFCILSIRTDYGMEIFWLSTDVPAEFEILEQVTDSAIPKLFYPNKQPVKLLFRLPQYAVISDQATEELFARFYSLGAFLRHHCDSHPIEMEFRDKCTIVYGDVSKHLAHYDLDQTILIDGVYLDWNGACINCQIEGIKVLRDMSLEIHLITPDLRKIVVNRIHHKYGMGGTFRDRDKMWYVYIRDVFSSSNLLKDAGLAWVYTKEQFEARKEEFRIRYEQNRIHRERQESYRRRRYGHVY